MLNSHTIISSFVNSQIMFFVHFYIVRILPPLLVTSTVLQMLFIICICLLNWFTVLFFTVLACGILVFSPGIEALPPELEGRVLTTRPPGKFS